MMHCVSAGIQPLSRSFPPALSWGLGWGRESRPEASSVRVWARRKRRGPPPPLQEGHKRAAALPTPVFQPVVNGGVWIQEETPALSTDCRPPSTEPAVPSRRVVVWPPLGASAQLQRGSEQAQALSLTLSPHGHSPSKLKEQPGCRCGSSQTEIQ